MTSGLKCVLLTAPYEWLCVRQRQWLVQLLFFQRVNDMRVFGTG